MPAPSDTLCLAYFSPLPPQRTGISDYSRELLPHLAELADVTVFVDDPTLVLDALRERFVIRPFTDYPSTRHQFDLPIYHLGNSQFHKNIYQTLTHFPGITVLHDYALHNFFASSDIWGNLVRYQRELGYAAGVEGTTASWQTMFGDGEKGHWVRPLNNRAIDLSLGLIAHSQFVITQIKTTHPQQLITQIPQLMPTQSGQSKRADLPFPQEAIIFASIGLLTPSKQIAFALRTFARCLATHPNLYYLLVGDVLPSVDLDNLISELGLQDRVFCAGYAADLQSFVDWIVSADVIVNLRYPTMGETSATALRAMAVGKPVMVFAHGWYAEIPAQACVQTPLLDEDAFYHAMLDLAHSATLRQEIGARALNYVQTVCHPQQIAHAYVAFAQSVLQKYGGGDA